jgi:hypothetical protein
MRLSFYDKNHILVKVINSDMTTAEEWSERSKLGEVCNVLGCQNTPSTQCPTCSHYYCYADIQTHNHIISEEEADEQIRSEENLR